MSGITLIDLYNKIDDIIKVSPAATDTTKLQGKRHKELLRAFADAIFQQAAAQASIPYPWNIPSTRPEYRGYFNNQTDLAAGLFEFFHPPQGPSASLSAINAYREIGSPTAVTLAYAFAPGSTAIDKAIVNGTTVPNSPPTGTVNTSTAPNTTTSFSMQVKDLNGLTATATAQVQYLSKYFIFTSPQPLGTTGTDQDLSNLLHTQNGFLTGSRQQSGQVNPQGEYYYVAFANSLGGASAIKTNGIQDTSITLRPLTYTNAQGANEAFTLYCGENLLTGIYNIEVQ